LRGKRYETEKKIWGGDRHSEEFKSSSLPNANLKDNPKTSEVLGSEYGVHKSTIIRNANFAKVIDILPEEVKHDVLSGEEKISRTMTDTILDFDKPTQKKFIKEKNVQTFFMIWQRKIRQPNIYLFPNIYNNISSTVRAFDGSIPFSLIIEQIKQINFKGVRYFSQ
jgi:hypothetical protein